VVLGVAGACVLSDPKHCENSGDPCGDGMVCDPCTSSNVATNGCVALGAEVDEDLDAAGCQAASEATTNDDLTVGEESTSTTDNPETMTTTIDLDTTATAGMTDTTADTGPPPTCDEPDGTFEGACEDPRPFCVGGECVECSSGDPLTTCAVAPETVCDPDGACVVCSSEDFSACMGETPYCDTSTGTCVPCTEHAQCGTSACNLFTGACVAGLVVNVAAGQSLSDALVMVTPGGGGTIIVSQGTYDVPLVVTGSVTVAFLANGDDRPVWQRTSGSGSQLRTTGGATVLVDGFDFRLNPTSSDPVIRVDETDSRLWVDRSIIAQNAGAGLRADFDGLAMLRNCFVLGANNRAAVEALMGGDVSRALV
jgi:hypothetical protein